MTGEVDQVPVDVEGVDVVDGPCLAGGGRPLRGRAGELEPPQLQIPADGQRERELPVPRTRCVHEQPFGRGEIRGREIQRPGDTREPGGDGLVDEGLEVVFRGDRSRIELRAIQSGGIAPILRDFPVGKLWWPCPENLRGGRSGPVDADSEADRVYSISE